MKNKSLIKLISSCFFLFCYLNSIAQVTVEITPYTTGITAYIFNTGLHFTSKLSIKNGTENGNADLVIPENIQGDTNNIIVITEKDKQAFIGKLTQVIKDKKISLQSYSPLPWITIDNNAKLVDANKEYECLDAHAGLTYSLENDLLTIIRMNIVGFNAQRLVFRSFDADSKGLPGLYLKTASPPFNKTISGFTDDYINSYIVPKIELAKELGMYTILDHHGMFIHDKNMMNEYDKNPDVYNAWLDLWEHLAQKFKDESSIAFYEVENEPGFKLNPDFILKMHNDVIQRIRKWDKKHIIAFGHSWANVPQELFLEKGIPDDPEHLLIYSMHHYYKKNKPVDGGIQDAIKTAEQISSKYHIPIWFGESGSQDDFSGPVTNMLAYWYDYADKNYISTDLWKDDEIMGENVIPSNASPEDKQRSWNLKYRVYIDKESDNGIRCFKDNPQNNTYIISNENNTRGNLYIRLRFPMFHKINILGIKKFSAGDKQPQILITQGYIEINGTFKEIKLSLT